MNRGPLRCPQSPEIPTSDICRPVWPRDLDILVQLIRFTLLPLDLENKRKWQRPAHSPRPLHGHTGEQEEQG